MLKQFLLTAVFSALALGAALAAEPASLSGNELRKAVSGKTIHLNVSRFELPICYSANGSMSGKMGTVLASFSRGDRASDIGKWWVADDQSARNGRVGWTGRPIATSSPDRATPCVGCAMMDVPAPRDSAEGLFWHLPPGAPADLLGVGPSTQSKETRHERLCDNPYSHSRSWLHYTSYQKPVCL
jgi:hypothetical protein